MASQSDHIALANKNHEALVYLIEDHSRFPEWIATIAFYKAVQVVEAVFDANMRVHSTSHQMRLQTLKTPRFQRIFRAYRPLLAASRIARYLEDHGPGGAGRFRTFTDHLTPDQVFDQLVYKRLYAVEQQSLTFLSDACKEALLKIVPPPRGSSE